MKRLGWWLMGRPWRFDTVEDFHNVTKAPWYYRLGAWLYNLR